MFILCLTVILAALFISVLLSKSAASLPFGDKLISSFSSEEHTEPDFSNREPGLSGSLFQKSEKKSASKELADHHAIPSLH